MNKSKRPLFIDVAFGWSHILLAIYIGLTWHKYLWYSRPNTKRLHIGPFKFMYDNFESLFTELDKRLEAEAAAQSFLQQESELLNDYRSTSETLH